jgi:hypothetical protein
MEFFLSGPELLNENRSDKLGNKTPGPLKAAYEISPQLSDFTVIGRPNHPSSG